MVQHSAPPHDVRLGPRDRARFWREPRHGGLECLSATFVTHRFPLHAHDSYVVGVMISGCNAFIHRGVRHYARDGDFVVLNPEEVHDGGAYDGGFTYRMSYPSLQLMEQLTADVVGRPKGPPFFRQTLQRDAQALAFFRLAHERLERGEDRLGADEYLVAAFALLVVRYGRAGAPPPVGRERGPVAKVRAYLDARFVEDVDLAALAHIARLSRHYLLRAFRRETGLTPHAYLVNRRVNRARELLAQGQAPAQVAAACGFFDQAHLTRVFKARTGVTPGAFRAG